MQPEFLFILGSNRWNILKEYSYEVVVYINT